MNDQLIHKLSQKITKLKSTVIIKTKIKKSLNKIIDAAVGNNIKTLVEKYKCTIPHSNDDNPNNICLIAPGEKYISIYINYLKRWNQLIIKEKKILD
jgi:hypothetical protein